MVYRIEKTFPNIHERMLPYVRIDKVTLGVGTFATEESVVVDQNSSAPGPRYQHSPQPPIEVVVDLACKDMMCTNEKSLLINDKYKPFFKIHVIESFEGWESESIYGINPNFNFSQMINNDGVYYLQHRGTYQSLYPDSLEYRAWIELDIAEYTNQLKIEDGYLLSANSNNGSFTGVMNEQKIIESGQVRSYVCYDMQTTIDDGHRHAVPSLVTGTPSATNKSHGHEHKIDAGGNVLLSGGGGLSMQPHIHYLIPMTIIIDNRVLSQIGAVGVSAFSKDTSPQSASRTKQIIENPYKDTLNRADSFNLFSDIYFSRDEENDLRFLFAIDMKKIMEKFSLANSIFVKPFSYKKILSDFRPSIYSLRVYRKRVKGTGSEKSEKFDSNQIEELIIDTNQNVGNIALNSIKYSNDVIPKSLRACSIEENFLNIKGDFGVRYFSGRDETIKLKTNGYYQYKVELDILDATVEIFKSHINSLKSTIKSYQEYYNKAVYLSSGIKNPYGNPHTNTTDDYGKKRKSKSSKKTDRAPFSGIKSTSVNTGGLVEEGVVISQNKSGIRSKKYEVGQYVPKNFNVITNKFSPDFAAKTNYDPSIALATYFEILFFYSNKPVKNVKSKIIALQNIVSPSSGSPEGILNVIGLMKDLQKQISSYLDISTSSKTKDDNKGNTAIVNKSHVEGGDRKKLTMIHLEHEFKALYDSNIPKDIGFNFLDLRDKNNLGLKQVTRTEFEDIISFENKKLFNTDNADLSFGTINQGDTALTSRYSYVTPTIININPKYSLNNGSKIPSFGNNLDDVAKSIYYSKVARGNHQFGQTYNPKSDKSLVGQTEKFDVKNADKPLNTIEKEKIKQGINITKEIDFADKTASFFAANEGITIVDPESVSLDDNPFKEIKDSNIDDVDKNEDYVENDLGKGKKSELNRAAKPILDNLLELGNNLVSPNIDDYKLDSNSNMKEKIDSLKPDESPTDVIKSLPNPLKILFKFNKDSPAADQTVTIREDVTRFLSKGINKDTRNTFRYKFQTIDTIEFLTHFDTTRKRTKTGKTIKNSQLAMPVWKPVTKSILQQTTGKDLLCRLQPYENSAVNIKRDKDYELPTYDEYFILKGS